MGFGHVLRPKASCFDIALRYPVTVFGIDTIHSEGSREIDLDLEEHSSCKQGKTRKQALISEHAQVGQVPGSPVA